MEGGEEGNKGRKGEGGKEKEKRSKKERKEGKEGEKGRREEGGYLSDGGRTLARQALCKSKSSIFLTRALLFQKTLESFPNIIRKLSLRVIGISARELITRRIYNPFWWFTVYYILGFQCFFVSNIQFIF